MGVRLGLSLQLKGHKWEILCFSFFLSFASHYSLFLGMMSADPAVMEGGDSIIYIYIYIIIK